MPLVPAVQRNVVGDVVVVPETERGRGSGYGGQILGYQSTPRDGRGDLLDAEELEILGGGILRGREELLDLRRHSRCRSYRRRSP